MGMGLGSRRPAISIQYACMFSASQEACFNIKSNGQLCRVGLGRVPTCYDVKCCFRLCNDTLRVRLPLSCLLCAGPRPTSAPTRLLGGTKPCSTAANLNPARQLVLQLAAAAAPRRVPCVWCAGGVVL
jgi:hypothetical protein